jgi:transposase
MTTVSAARAYAEDGVKAANATRLKPVMAVADLVLSHLEQIINFARNAVTNAGAEGINSVVMTIQPAPQGYRTWRTSRMGILFFCGGLDLRPGQRAAACP